MTSRLHSLHAPMAVLLASLMLAPPLLAQMPSSYPPSGIVSPGYPASATQGLPSYPAITDVDPVEALSRYLRMLASNPRDLSSLTGAGRAALAVGDANAAIGFYARAEELAPRNGRIKAGLASALVQMEQPRTALKLFGEAVALGVPVGEIAADRGLAHDLGGDGRAAQADYTLALRAKDDPETVRRLALSMAISGDRAGALTMLDPLLRRSDSGAIRARAFVLALTGDQAGAARVVQTAMPGAQGTAMTSFLGRLSGLNPAQKALAVNFGYFPSDGRSYSAAELFADSRYGSAGVASSRTALSAPSATASSRDTPLIPAGAPLGQRLASTSVDAGAPRRRPGEIAAVEVAPPAHVFAAPIPGVTQPPSAASRQMAAQAGTAAVAVAGSPPGVGGASPVIMSAIRPESMVSGTIVVPGSAAAPPPAGASSHPAPVAIAQPPVSAAFARSGAVGSGASPAPAGGPATVTSAVRLPTVAPSPGGQTVVASAAAAAQTAASGASARPFASSPTASPPAASAVPSPAPGSLLITDAGPTLATGRVPVAGETPIATVDLPPASIDPASVARPVPSARSSAPPTRQAAVAPSPRPIVRAMPTARVDAAKIFSAEAAKTTKAAAKADTQEKAGKLSAEKLAAAKGKNAGKAEADTKAEAAMKAKADAKEKAASKGKPGATDKADSKNGDARGRATTRTAAAAKAKADAEAKTKADADAKTAKSKVGERYWVQVASGANKANLDKAWSNVKGKAPTLLNGRSTYTAPWRASNRLLIGPFKTEGEAQAEVNRLGKAGVGGIQFTTRAGVDVEKVGAK